MDELEQQLQKQGEEEVKRIEEEIEELEKKKASLSKELEDYEKQRRGLEDAIAALRAKLSEYREKIKELKEQDKSKFETYKMAKVGEVISRLSDKLPSLADEDTRLKVLEAWQNKFSTDTLDEKELETQILLSYMYVKPQEVKELLRLKETMEKSKEEFIKNTQQLSSVSSEEVSSEEITEEDRRKAAQYGVSPETIARMRKGETKSTFLTGKEPYIEY